VRTLISTGRSSNRVFRFATARYQPAGTGIRGRAHARAASLFSLSDTELMSRPIASAMRVNSALGAPVRVCSSRCLDSAAARTAGAERDRIESTQPKNSVVRSCTGMVVARSVEVYYGSERWWYKVRECKRAGTARAKPRECVTRHHRHTHRH
jgi:hypothetical protein